MEQAFAAAAQTIGCDVAAIRAVCAVEASDRYLDAAGVPVRRFEPHHFPREHWPALGFAPAEGQAPWRASLAVGKSARARMFATAAGIAHEAACRAASWGGFQVMGFNHAAAGYDAAALMVRGYADPVAQVASFAALIVDWDLDGAVRAHDWLTFAARYNGSGQAPVYAAKIESAYKRESGGARSIAIIRIGARGEDAAAVQEALAAAGYLSPDQVDAAFGPATRDAVRAYQRDHGLTVDGVVGARTWAALTAGAPKAETPAPKKQETKGKRDLVEVAKIGTAAAGGVATTVGAVGGLDGTAQTILIGAICAGALGWLAWKFVLPRVRA